MMDHMNKMKGADVLRSVISVRLEKGPDYCLAFFWRYHRQVLQ